MGDDLFSSITGPSWDLDNPIQPLKQFKPEFNLFSDFADLLDNQRSFSLSPFSESSLTENPALDFPLANDINSLFAIPPLNQHKRTVSSPATVSRNIPTLKASPLISNVRPYHNRKNRQEENLTEEQLRSNEAFANLCKDSSIMFNPKTLHFFPRSFWQDKNMTFGQLVTDFFHRKNSSTSRFSHKLFNALQITKNYPQFTDLIGICWVNKTVLKVNKISFGRLLNIKTIDGSLFHQQGNFPTHGFVEIESREALQYVTPNDLQGVDFEVVRLLRHTGKINRESTEEDIEKCKWISSKKREF